ncbi:hypothetical protein SARC_03825 [Sphaeroforma arctica JP610]|uniref:Phospholipase B-like n=1 Tax=Sphaeroforma arctica JP610 TaxID=667725 RepID=A0A0L0G562_9EUKA|nr:hypothetical protein SARC_03825 [Sphaeroforma arctica JP610]KNC83961.1 hypothetical protein SARC_03825 [Sphaeroforma arctica JP610]|eukprot:XP_014157863.1 hypothetical protein SARC_03825 [Sphaeroforma arctica JP610]
MHSVLKTAVWLSACGGLHLVGANPVKLTHMAIDEHSDINILPQDSLTHLSAHVTSKNESPKVFVHATAQEALTDKGAAAAASFKNEYNTTGWDKLWVTTSEKENVESALFAAGYLEGMLTWQSIYSSWVNMRADWFDGGLIPIGLQEWIADNIEWTRYNAEHDLDHWTQRERAFWAGVNNTIDQLDGLVMGYQDHADAARELTKVDIYMLSADGDLETLVPMYTEESRKEKAEQEQNEWESGQEEQRKNDRCSALFKVLPDKSDIFMGHATWDHYQLMVRQLKTYDFRLQCSPESIARGECEVQRNAISFSSTPGFLWSLDDFYLTTAGLLVMETTNNNYNDALTHTITHKSVPCWIRGTVANLLAEDPEEWSEIFGIHNSGTYDSQWMVLDLNQFTAGQDLPPKSFYVLEQLPGIIRYQDMTQQLNEDGYWASYNVPYFPEIYEKSGWSDKYEKGGDEWSHEKCPRANIFRQQQSSVTDMDSMKRMLRYNDYENDPLSLGQPGNAVAGRWDLAKGEKFQLDGAIDAKVTNIAMGRDMKFWAVNGPTSDQQPVFTWKAYENITHMGQPDVFDFDWVEFQPFP